jgi:Flp pilus assembly protein TadG
MRARSQKLSKPPRRLGIVALEFLLVFPLLLILLLAIFEFGLILAAAKHVENAARLGAKYSAEAGILEGFNDPGTMDNLKERVDQYLNTAGYTDSCQVILEHNVFGVGNPSQPNPLMSDPNCPCNPVIGPIASLPMHSVRVTVCLPMTGNIPNCLSSFGFDISGCVVRGSVVWIYEQLPVPPRMTP